MLIYNELYQRLQSIGAVVCAFVVVVESVIADLYIRIPFALSARPNNAHTIHRTMCVCVRVCVCIIFLFVCIFTFEVTMMVFVYNIYPLTNMRLQADSSASAVVPIVIGLMCDTVIACLAAYTFNRRNIRYQQASTSSSTSRIVVGDMVCRHFTSEFIQAASFSAVIV